MCLPTYSAISWCRLKSKSILWIWISEEWNSPCRSEICKSETLITHQLSAKHINLGSFREINVLTIVLLLLHLSWRLKKNWTHVKEYQAQNCTSSKVYKSPLAHFDLLKWLDLTLCSSIRPSIIIYILFSCCIVLFLLLLYIWPLCINPFLQYITIDAEKIQFPHEDQ